jgi:Outer membrane protein beta-barrel domain
MRPHMRRALPALLLVPLLWAPAYAQYGRPAPRRRFERGYELTPYLTFNEFQSKTALDDDIGAGFRFGYLYTPHHEIEFLIDGVSTTGTVVDSSSGLLIGTRDDLTNYQVAYVYNFTKRDIIPYVTAGLGFLHTDDDVLGTETDGVLALGGGVRFFLGRSVYARFEVRDNAFRGDLPVYLHQDFHNRVYSAGIGWRFGAP